MGLFIVSTLQTGSEWDNLLFLETTNNPIHHQGCKIKTTNSPIHHQVCKV
jgi:hypothetical protein